MFYDEASREHELYEEKITDWVQQMVEEGNGKEVDKKLLKRVKYVYDISIVYWNLHISCLKFLNIRNKKKNPRYEIWKKSDSFEESDFRNTVYPSYTVHPHLPPSNFSPNFPK